MQMVERWDVAKLTEWLMSLDPPLHSQDIEKIVETPIDRPELQLLMQV